MAQQFPPNGGRGGHGGRGPPSGGRGSGRGAPQQQQTPTQPYNNSYPASGSGRGGPRPGMGAWQATPPSSALQQAALQQGGYPGVPPSQQGQARPVPAAAYGAPPVGYYPNYGGGPGAAPQYGSRPNPGQWSGQPTYVSGPGPGQPSAMRGGIFYPGAGSPHMINAIPPVPMPQSQIAPPPPPPREKKPLIITVRTLIT